MSQKMGFFGGRSKRKLGIEAEVPRQPEEAAAAAPESSARTNNGGYGNADDNPSSPDEETGVKKSAGELHKYGATTDKDTKEEEEADAEPNAGQNEHEPLVGMHLELDSGGCSSKDGLDHLTEADRKAGCDAEVYLQMGMLHRAFPERTFALLVTLLVELPTLFIISGGSEKLCALIGRKRYQLLVAFLPLTSAISGNVGLQASTLTTRAVSHLHVTRRSYGIWLRTEVGAAFFQGLGMGLVSGIFAYVASGNDFAFGLTIFLAQFVSILTAGFTGTLAPIIFTFVLHMDSGQWGGPLETAIQDIIGSFAMVVMSYHVLDWLGPHEVEFDDVCGL